MAVVDYEKELKKHNEEARQQSEAVFGEKGVLREDEVTIVPEMKDSTKTVDPATGHASETSVPRDPNVQPNGNGANGRGGAQNPPQPQRAPQNAPQQPAQPQTAPQQPLVNSVIVSAKEFESEKKSFLNPDVEKGFWDTLDQKLKEALSGNTADEVGQNMAFAALTFLFDAIGNWATHHRKEAKRVKKEYEEKTKAFDDVLKNTLVEKYGAVAEYAIKNGINVTTKAGREKLEKLRNNKEFLGLCAGALSTTLMREVKPDEAGKILEGTTKALSRGNLALNSQEVANALGTQDARENAAYWDKRAKGQKMKVKNLAQYRAQLQAARNGQHQQQQQQQQRRPQQQQQSP